MECPAPVAIWIWTRRWSALPDVLWFLVASPLMGWALGHPVSRWWRWPL